MDIIVVPAKMFFFFEERCNQEYKNKPCNTTSHTHTRKGYNDGHKNSWCITHMFMISSSCTRELATAPMKKKNRSKKSNATQWPPFPIWNQWVLLLSCKKRREEIHDLTFF